jgi:hypothetical protein
MGCILSQSLSQVSHLCDFSNLVADPFKYNILPEAVMKRLRFATTAMHAYGHEWSCQLVYNPCICEGLGLSDGEGTKRLWSRFIRLIGIQHSSFVCILKILFHLY